MRGYNAEKSKDYYNRFYKFAPVGSRELYLKDLVYTKSYTLVSEMLAEDSDLYSSMMAGRVGVNTLKLAVIEPKNNLNDSDYFEAMVKKLREFVVKKLQK